MADTKPPSPHQLSGIYDEIRSILDDFAFGATIVEFTEAGLPGHPKKTPDLDYLFRMMEAARRDGYRSSTRPSEGPKSTVYDDEGDAMPPLSDPVGELAIAEDQIVDPVRIQGASVLRGLTKALGELRMARGAMITALGNTQTEIGEPGCEVHVDLGMWEEVTRSGRCNWCYQFWLTYGTNPPSELLIARAGGKRITQQMITEAMKPKMKAGKRVKVRRR